MSIRIQNPTPGGATHTTRQRALHFIRLGIAVWSDQREQVIVFSAVANDRMVKRHEKQARRADSELRQHEKQTRIGYGEVQRRMTEREIRALPIAGDSQRLLAKELKGAWAWDRAVRAKSKAPGPVRIIPA